MPARAVGGAARALGLEGRRVLVAVSGGVDSTVLLDLLAGLREPLDLGLVVGHVNHGLRGAESDADEAAVRAEAARQGLPVAVAAAAIEALRAGRTSRERPTLQEAARRVRDDALRRLAAEAGAERIATAHTLDDQAETVLLRLLRGASPDGLGGIPERTPDGVVVRPLLGVSRATVERHARERRLTWREDASNRDPRFARARLRGSGLAGIAEALNPRWLRAVGDLAEAQRRDAEWIGRLVAEAAGRVLHEERDGLWIDAEALRALPPALGRRVAREALRRAGAARDVSRRHIERGLAFLATARRGAALELPGGLRLVHTRRGFVLGPRSAPGGPASVHPPAGC